MKFRNLSPKTAFWSVLLLFLINGLILGYRDAVLQNTRDAARLGISIQQLKDSEVYGRNLFFFLGAPTILAFIVGFPLAKLFERYTHGPELRLPDAFKNIGKNLGVAILIIIAIDLAAIVFVFLFASDGLMRFFNR